MQSSSRSRAWSSRASVLKKPRSIKSASAFVFVCSGGFDDALTCLHVGCDCEHVPEATGARRESITRPVMGAKITSFILKDQRFLL